MTRLVLVGGGLATGLIALRMLSSRPEVDLTVVEAGPSLGGNHTWSFHASDLSAGQHAWIAPLVTHRWTEQQVRFPGLRSTRQAGYLSITSQTFARVLTQVAGDRIRLDSAAAELGPGGVTLTDGRHIEADAVVDGRGFQSSPAMSIRFQTFLGRELRFARPHGLTAPIIMDATTTQEDGYRFTYVLPFTADTALVEDTAYQDGGRVDGPALGERIDAYCRAQGWQVAATLRQEGGALPITLDGDVTRFLAELGPVPAVGLRGNFFHPVTGFSLPDAVRVADLLADLPRLDTATVHAALAAHRERLWRQQAFLRAVNRMFFLAGRPDDRWRVMERFHRLPDGLIARFYSARLTRADKLRILVGKPPVPVVAAVRALRWQHTDA